MSFIIKIWHFNVYNKKKYQIWFLLIEWYDSMIKKSLDLWNSSLICLKGGDGKKKIEKEIVKWVQKEMKTILVSTIKFSNT